MYGLNCESGAIMVTVHLATGTLKSLRTIRAYLDYVLGLLDMMCASIASLLSVVRITGKINLRISSVPELAKAL